MTHYRDGSPHWGADVVAGVNWTALSFLPVLLAIGASSVHSFGAASPPVPVKAELVSEASAGNPGRSLSLGLWFEMNEGWHIYWLNPGDSGEPPRVEWQLPEGFQAGTIQWPTPHRIADHTLVDYGYEGNVLLIVPIHLPATLRSGGAARLEATVKYLVCRDICIPETANLTLSLPIRKGGMTASKWRSQFIRTRARLPRHAPASWKANAVAERNRFVLTLRTGAAEREAVFFPFEADQIKNAAPQQAVPLQDGVRLSLQMSDLLLKPVSRLRGVVVLGDQKAFVLDAPVSHGAR